MFSSIPEKNTLFYYFINQTMEGEFSKIKAFLDPVIPKFVLYLILLYLINIRRRNNEILSAFK